jgi:hypothetical protein
MTKTVLAPNAPWPKPDEKLEVKQKWKIIHISYEKNNLDYFLNTYEEPAQKHRIRDKLSGRFKSH